MTVLKLKIETYSLCMVSPNKLYPKTVDLMIISLLNWKYHWAILSNIYLITRVICQILLIALKLVTLQAF